MQRQHSNLRLLLFATGARADNTADAAADCSKKRQHN
jgi:hypothetical protein